MHHDHPTEFGVCGVNFLLAWDRQAHGQTCCNM